MAVKAVKAENLIFSYASPESKAKSLSDVSLAIKKGEFIAVLGANGSGKTTLARHFNALLPVQNGKLIVAELDASDKSKVWEIRKNCGMVFQNPDNQFVSSLVEEDVAFAPRNFGIPENEIPKRVKSALETVGLSGFEKRSSHMLSGGQKQRVAIAGVLSCKPDIIIFDEATAMLDPEGRWEVLKTIKKLHHMGHTIIMISHYVEEAVSANRIILMKSGSIIADGKPKEVLTDLSLLHTAGLEPPVAVQAYYDLKKRGIALSKCPLTNEELVDELCRLN
ncbi:MAG: energy-coupling factor transporter ATPase [Eubacterium sp.]|nr:energy-coupling factor transporter ATPase [Eubacterium sp.]